MLLYFFQSILGIFISALTGSEDPEEVALMAKQGTEVKLNIFYLATLIIEGSTNYIYRKGHFQSISAIYLNNLFASYILKAFIVINSYYLNR